jgi:hypothetical protein
MPLPRGGCWPMHREGAAFFENRAVGPVGLYDCCPAVDRADFMW